MRVRKDFERPEGFRTARLVIIAAEGRYTENIYFEAMKAALCSTDVHVEVLRRDNDESSPESVFRQIQGFMAEYNIDDDDELWIVVDKDKWRDKMLSSVAQYCAQNLNLNFCVSNPCFELWLLLHIEDVNSYSAEDRIKVFENKKSSRHSDPWLKCKLRSLLGHYKESDYDADHILQTVDYVIQRAELLDINKNDRWPQSLGTRVYLLANSILGQNN